MGASSGGDRRRFYLWCAWGMFILVVTVDLLAIAAQWHG
jgi:hypothetical protein